MDALPRLLALAAGQTASLVNISELAAPFQVSRPTIREYVTLLSRIFLLEESPPWHSNRLKRLIKTPKRHLTIFSHYTHVGLESLESAVASFPRFGLAPEVATPASNDEDEGVNENSATLKPA